MSPGNFADRVHEAIRRKNSRVVIGLDPDWERLPQPLREQAHAVMSPGTRIELWAIREFCESIIEATADLALAFKPQIAFFERYGADGIRVLQRILEDHPNEKFILDCKRGDIGNTSKAYARAYFHHQGEEPAPLPSDAVTHNAYFGRDSLEPYFEFLADGKGMFVLVRTSNPSAGEFQDLESSGAPLYEHVARRVAEWGKDCIGKCGYSSLGLVVGATFPEEAKRVRSAAPQALVLVPGFGSQGGDIKSAGVFCGEDGNGAIHNFSRAVIYAFASGPFSKEHPDEQYGQAARVAADFYRVRLNEILGQG